MLPIWLLAAMMMMIYDDDDVLLEVLGTLHECYVSSLLGLTTFPPTRARALAENDSLQRVIRMQRVGESFSANACARARWRKRCETKATTNIAFAQGCQNLQ